MDRDRRRRGRDGWRVRVPADDRHRGSAAHRAGQRPERGHARSRGVLAALLRYRDPAHGARSGARLARRAAHAHRRGAAGRARARAADGVHPAARMAAGRRRALRRVPHPERARGARSMIAPIAILVIAALIAFAIRKRVDVAGPFAATALIAAMWLIVSSPQETTEFLG